MSAIPIILGVLAVLLMGYGGIVADTSLDTVPGEQINEGG